MAIAVSGSLDVSNAAPTCASEGTALTISANDVKFDKDCLVAPAGTEFTIAFENKENVAHNVAIYTAADRQTVLFKGTIFNGPETMTYTVPAQAEGTYVFLCDPHKNEMQGTFVVGDPPATTTSAPPPPTTTTTAGLVPTLPMP